MLSSVHTKTVSLTYADTILSNTKTVSLTDADTVLSAH